MKKIKENKQLTVLSIDPGLHRTGFAILKQIDGNIKPITYGCIETKPQTPLPERLLSIYTQLSKMTNNYHPTVLAIEKQYFSLKLSSNSSLFAMSQARGVVLLLAAKNNMKVAEYSPNYVKIALTGYGRADKSQVQSMVKRLLYIKEINGPDDISDAIAVGLCHLHSTR